LLGVAGVVLALVVAGCGGGGGDDKRKGAVRSRPVLLGVTAGQPLIARPSLAGREIAAMAAAGVTTLRVPVYWDVAQPYPSPADVPAARREEFPTRGGRPTSFAGFDPIVAAAARERVALLPVVLGAPRWAARHPGRVGSPPAGTRPYAAFLGALIDRYGPRGSFWREHRRVPARPVRDWQIWNEPNHLAYWSDQPYARRYVQLARAARAAVKGADPGARVVMAGFPDRSWDELAAIYRAGAKGVFDVAATHPYTFEPANVLRIVRLDRRALRRSGDPDRPLWLTEVTWSSGRRPGRRPFPFETTPTDQAARLARALPLLVRERRALGVERIYWESWSSTDRDTGNPFDYSGLRVIGPDGRAVDKPAFGAFRRFAVGLEKCLSTRPSAACG
jgi:polysaccharide biosynthesis protein PslG